MRKLVLLPLLFATAALAQTPVVTRSGDNARTGDFQETTITVDSLKAKGITLRTTIPVIGDARGMEAQPLILPGVKVANGSTHDVMVLPSMANVVRGVDAHTGAGLWQTTLGNPVQGGPSIDAHLINDKWGVLSTPVLDPETKRAYMVAWISPDGTPQKGIHYLFTLNVATGAIVGTPATFAGLSQGTQRYSDTMRKQRCSLVAVSNGGHTIVLGAYGTVLETGKYAAGAIFAYDTVLAKFTAFLPMSQGLGAGIWMGGQGLAADAAGNEYGQTGNGSFNAVNDFGESIFKVVYTPASGPSEASLKVVTWFSPFSDAGRIGLDPSRSAVAAALSDKLAGVSAPSVQMALPVGASMTMPANTRTVLSHDPATGHVIPLVYPANPADPAWGDQDLGAGGCTYVTQYGKLACGGKDGLLYVVNADNMGNTMPADFAHPKTNCARLASPPVWFTESPGPVDPCPQEVTTLDFMPWGKTRHLHMTPVQYMSPTKGLVLFGWGENSTLHAWAMSSSGQMTYLAESREIASVGSVNNSGGMPGGFCALSTNNFKVGTSILWCSIPLADANANIVGGRLLAYEAENYARDTDGVHLVKLWDSQDWNIRYIFNKFMPPIVWDGEVILPNYNGGVMVFTQ
jgi:hypothetical protein